jgi:hypothetical protein
MLKLELNTENLNVEFSCHDQDGDHLGLLNILNALIRELSTHENVNLVIRSLEDTETSEEQYLEEYPAREE